MQLNKTLPFVEYIVLIKFTSPTGLITIGLIADETNPLGSLLTEHIPDLSDIEKSSSPK